ncbi:OFA family MFS transporter [Sporosarcina pasteurii]|uniref:Inner membrane protein yhjX n=1 Tax=Sporosarcina pasteurii TaxID=1474 RepID=A0A380CJR4_SPOPA|nr:OFA family MFS transporter [Sporosarcina pasteurii]MDS9471870.1 OFA family MFS transporter [Sporosarcina pasteurii]QBQ06608.1 MFS transporter [Sporosarcina pasteurii]SUJ21994.1 Inner membrane protein yhjX [Sporosarcina pasteurii]
MNIKLNRWRVLIASTIINLCVGAVYAFSIFALPLTEVLDASISEIMIAFTINAALFPIPMILGGKLVDKGKAKIAIMLGGSLFGVGFVLSGLVTATWMLYITYGVIGGLGQGMVYSATIGNSVKLFPDKKGLATGIVTAGYGGGAILIAPIANALISSKGVQPTLIALGITFLVVILSFGLLVKACPVGYLPQGWTPPEVNKGGSIDIPWKQMVRKPIFYVIISMFCIGALSGMMITSNASVIGQTMFGLSAATAALYVSLYSLSNCLGRVFWGAVSDKIGRTKCLMVIYVVIAAMMLTIAMSTSVAGFVVAIIGIGLCFGGTMGIFPSIVSEKFGMKYYGVNYGITFIGYSGAAFFGPRIANSVAAQNDGMFTNAFYIALVISLVGLLLTFVFKALENKKQTVSLSATESVVN